MSDADKGREAELAELEALRRRVRELERLETRSRGTLEELQVSKAYYEQLFASAQEAIVLSDNAGQVLGVNPEFCRLFGYLQSEAEGRLIDDLIASEELRDEALRITRRVASGERASMETIRCRRDGQAIAVSILASPIIVDGRQQAVYAIYRDISERTQTQRALEESEQRYRDLVEKAGIAILIDDEQGRFRYHNAQFLALFGYNEQQMKNQSLRSLVHPDDATLVMGHHENRLAGDEDVPSKYRFRGLRRDGTTIHLEVEATPIVTAEGRGATLSHIWDVTQSVAMEQELRRHRDHLGELAGERGAELRATNERLELEVQVRRQAEDALRESEARYRAVVEQTTDAIYLAEPTEGRMLEGNAAMQRLLGYSREELLGLTIFDVLAHDAADVNEKIQRILSTGQTFFAERNYRRKDGSLLRMEVSVDLISWRDQEVLCIVARDITERKRAEEERARLQAQLLQSQKMEAVGTLAGGVAHDFNNLMTTIIGYSELIDEKLDEANPLSRDLTQIRRAAGRAGELTRQLLQFSRRQPVDLRPISLNDTVEALLKMIRRIIGEDVDVATTLQPDLWAVRADAGSIEQVLMNLAVNARDAMPGGGRLLIQTENVDVDQEHRAASPQAQPGRALCLSVTDTGTGMDADTVEHIFEPFFTTKEVGEGTGLGLAVVFGIVQQHDGWITIESVPGQGTTFQVYLPAMRSEAPTSRAIAAPRQDWSGEGERILLVEDEGGVRRFGARALRDAGYTVLTAGSVQAALKVFEAEAGAFELVFSDVVLPDGSGVDLVMQLLERRPGLGVLLTSGYSSPRSKGDMIRSRGYPFLPKPFSLASVLEAIHGALERSRTVTP